MFAKIENGVPVEWNIPNIRQRFPQTSFPAEITDSAMPDSYVIVRAAASHYPAPGQKVVPAAPVLADGKWVTGWEVVAMSTEEIAERDQAQAVAVRSDRDSRLAACDWVVAKAYEQQTPVPSAWVDYRQKLRDVPAQQGFPYTVVWPTKPE